ncbi:MAG: BlaI/MecI/CopY family transcriptional regulator [Bacteroidota bacterium]
MHKPTERELEILQVLWKKGTCTVREVYEELSQDKEVGYTTVLKFMQIMHDKGLVSREKEGKTHFYRSEITQDKTQNQLIDQLLHSAFGGSAMKLVMQALGNQNSSKEELDEIKKYIDKLQGGQK